MDEVRMTFRIPSDAADYLDRKAKEELTSRNAQVVRAVRQMMKNEKTEATAS